MLNGVIINLNQVIMRINDFVEQFFKFFLHVLLSWTRKDIVCRVLKLFVILQVYFYLQ